MRFLYFRCFTYAACISFVLNFIQYIMRTVCTLHVLIIPHYVVIIIHKILL